MATPSYNRYQTYRQYAINPNYVGFKDPIDDVSTLANQTNWVNPCTVLTSALVNQKNILRFQNVKPVPAEYLLRSKSATAISRLLTKLMNDNSYQAYYSESTRNDNYFVGIVTIPNFDTSINLSDYQLLIFDKDGFRISDHGSTTWYVVNGTLYIVLMNCTNYIVPLGDEASFSDTVDIVFLRKIGNRDPIKIGLLEFEDGHTSITDDMQDIPRTLYLHTENIDKSITLFNKYNACCYGVALYVSDYIVKQGDIYEQDGVVKTVNSETRVTIQHAIDQTGIKNWLFIDPSKYTVNNDNPDVTLATFKNGINAIEDLDLWIYAEYTAQENADNDISLPRIRIKIKRLSSASKFYLYNTNTFLKTEYSYEYNETRPIITISRDSTTGKSAIERSFAIDRNDGDNSEIIGQYPYYIPMNWKDPNVCSDDENIDSHIYSRWIDTEDVFVFVDGVKLTPYKDYVVSNTGIVGEDIPSGSIKFINRINPDWAVTFPVNDKITKHTILAFTVPSSRSVIHNDEIDGTRVSYVGPVPDRYDMIHDVIKEKIFANNFGDEPGLYYPIIDVSLPDPKIPPSMLTPESYIVFASGRYQKAYTNRKTNILDDMLSLENLKTYNDIEYHSYFDDSRYAITGILEYTWDNCYFPLIITAIENLDGILGNYINNYAANNLPSEDDPDHPEEKLRRINEISSNRIGSPIDFIYNEGTSIFDNWLKHNTRLAYKHDIDAQVDESIRRVPDRQTYFSANEDLSLRGYKNNIRVHGGTLVSSGDGTVELINPDMHGMPEYTASNDINNTENIEDAQNP